MLSKAEKYINDEEALMSKWGSSSARKKKSKDDEETETDLHEGIEKTKIDLQREEVTSGTT